MSLLPKNKVLVPIDFSDASFQALEETLTFIEDPAKVYVLHVLTPISAIEPGVMWEMVSNQTRKESVEKAFSQRCQGMIEKGIHF